MGVLVPLRRPRRSLQAASPRSQLQPARPLLKQPVLINLQLRYSHRRLQTVHLWLRFQPVNRLLGRPVLINPQLRYSRRRLQTVHLWLQFQPVNRLLGHPSQITLQLSRLPQYANALANLQPSDVDRTTLPSASRRLVN